MQVKFRFDEKVATALTLQTALGAAQMAITSSNTPSELRKNVTSPNGTTQAALEVFDRAQISKYSICISCCTET